MWEHPQAAGRAAGSTLQPRSNVAAAAARLHPRSPSLCCAGASSPARCCCGTAPTTSTRPGAALGRQVHARDASRKPTPRPYTYCRRLPGAALQLWRSPRRHRPRLWPPRGGAAGGGAAQRYCSAGTSHRGGPAAGSLLLAGLLAESCLLELPRPRMPRHATPARTAAPACLHDTPARSAATCPAGGSGTAGRGAVPAGRGAG